MTGLEAVPVRVECDVGAGLPCVQVVGLPATSVREATARIRSALRNSGLDFPLRRVTVNLAPAEIRKQGSGLDLPMAAAILKASGQLGERRTDDFLLVGELGLDGTVAPVAGVLAMALLARQSGQKLVVPVASGPEAAAVPEVEVFTVDRLSHFVAWTRGGELPRPTSGQEHASGPEGPDLADIRGHELPKRALCAAAAGGHHLLLIGPPGAGKTMLASSLVRLLPPLSSAESLEVTRIWSVAGMLPPGRGLMRNRPWRAPHPHLSKAGLVGGGSHTIRPGEVSLSHLGVLFLDEMNRFPGDTLEALRGPLEEGRVTLGRLGAGVTFPARCLLVGAMNPCHCGRRGDPEHPCQCTGQQVARYWDRLSGPLLDRIDLQVEVRRLKWHEWQGASTGLSSRQAAALVTEARARQAVRLASVGKRLNAEMNGREVERLCPLPSEAEQMLAEAFRRLALSSRGYHRILKVARTLADLDGAAHIGRGHLSEALAFRCLHWLRRP